MSNYFMDRYVCLSTPLKFTRCLMHTPTYEKLVKIIWIAVQCKNKTANTVALKCNSIVYYYCYCFRFDATDDDDAVAAATSAARVTIMFCVIVIIISITIIILCICSGEPLNELSKFSHAKYNTNFLLLLSLLIYNKCWFTHNKHTHKQLQRMNHEFIKSQVKRYIANNEVRDECVLIEEIRQPSNLTLKFVHKQYQDHFQCINISAMWKFKHKCSKRFRHHHR